jgi:carbamoyltransferase
MDYFCYTYSTEQTFNQKFVDLFGEPRQVESEFYTATTHPNHDHPQWDSAVAAQNQKYADIAASIQHVTEDIMLQMARTAMQRSGEKKLCMAGGVALNSVGNGRIINETDVEDLYIQPAAGDSGGALGAALYAYHILLGQPRKFVMEHAYWGQAYAPAEIQAFLQHKGVKYEHIEDDERLTDRVTAALLQGKVVGLFQGRFEWGPRALGNRSILADPRRPEMKDLVNAKIKFREPFRPFAPVIVEECTGDYFKLPQPERHFPACFMLLVVPIHSHQQDKIGAVNHLGTGRLQTIRKETNANYFLIAHKFGQATGVPVVLNTSFNLRGEPIVTSPANAFWTFSNSGIDMLALDHFLISKESMQ